MLFDNGQRTAGKEPNSIIEKVEITFRNDAMNRSLPMLLILDEVKECSMLGALAFEMIDQT